MNFDLSGRRIAIIGGAGFIGHNLALDLKEAGANVDIIDSLQVNNLLMFASGSADNEHRELYTRIINERLDLLRNAGIALHPQDARDYHALSRIIGDIKPQIVIHLAAVSHAGRSNKDPYSTFDHSLRTLENALDCSKDRIEHFIYFSSSMVYGNFQTDEVTEEHPLEPIGIYGALKVGGEKMVIAYQQVSDLPYTIVRPSALYGPRCVSRRVSQVFIEDAFFGKSLTVRGDGSERVDFTYIDDLKDGIKRVITNPAARNQIFNMTYGAGRSIDELVQVLKPRFPQLEVEYKDPLELVPRRGGLSIQKAKDILEYSPKHPLELGLLKYVQWYQDGLLKDSEYALKTAHAIG